MGVIKALKNMDKPQRIKDVLLEAMEGATLQVHLARRSEER